MLSEELAVHRMHYRVCAGGHRVPEDKIRARYRRPSALVADAITRCGQATVYDNSPRRRPRIVAQLSAGLIVGRPAWPQWAPPELTARWPQ
jgi:predicted ABC-type ATPase